MIQVCSSLMRFIPSTPCRRLAVAGASFLFMFGCAPRSHPRSVASRPIVIGEIAIVDEKTRFVLIDLASYLYVPEPGASLRSRNRSGETARLKASPEQKRPFIAADIVAGNPAVGDQVVR